MAQNSLVLLSRGECLAFWLTLGRALFRMEFLGGKALSLAEYSLPSFALLLLLYAYYYSSIQHHHRSLARLLPSLLDLASLYPSIVPFLAGTHFVFFCFVFFGCVLVNYYYHYYDGGSKVWTLEGRAKQNRSFFSIALNSIE